MTIVVTEISTTGWTLSAQLICRDALEHLEAIGVGETMSPADLSVALRGLDAVLKELPLSGYHWPKLSGETALTWASATPQTISLPVDYYDYPLAWKTVNGELVPLVQIPHATWIGMNDRTATAEQPTHFYVSPSKVLHFYPVPTVDPVAKLQYQRVVDDAVSGSAPDVLQTLFNALGYGVANEIKFKFGVNPQKAEGIRLTWEQKKALALESAVSYEPIVFSVAD